MKTYRFVMLSALIVIMAAACHDGGQGREEGSAAAPLPPPDLGSTGELVPAPPPQEIPSAPQGPDAVTEPSATSEGPDTTPPDLVLLAPACGTLDVDPRTAITAQFSEAILPASVTSDSFAFVQDGLEVVGARLVDGDKITFTPARPLSLSRAYTVIMTAGISDTAGNILQGAIECGFVVRDGAWGAPTAIDRDTAEIPQLPQIAVARSGDIFAVWEEFVSDGSSHHVWANRYDGGAWGLPTRLDKVTDAREPRIAVDAEGNAIALWRQDRGGGLYDIMAKRYEADTDRWGQTAVIETSATNTREPRIAMDNEGRALAVWMQLNDAGIPQIWGNTYNPTSGAWGGPLLIGDGNTAEVAVNTSGRAVVAWVKSRREGENNLFWLSAAPFDIATRRLGAASDMGRNLEEKPQPRVAIDGAGTAYLAWFDANDGVLRFAQTNSDGGWGPLGYPSAASGATEEHDLAVDRTGRYTIAWMDTARKLLARGGDRSGWGPSTTLAAIGTSPRLGVDNAGGVTAVWVKDDVEPSHLFASRRLAGGGWGPVAQIDASILSGVEGTHLAVLPDGTAVAVWVQSTASGPDGRHIFVSHFH